jgi:hypothetical protein
MTARTAEMKVAPFVLHPQLEALDLQMIEQPVAAPIIARSRKGTGVYAQVLTAALQLKPTTMETGLAPHFEWQADSLRQLRTKILGLQMTKRKNQDKFHRVFFMQRSNPDEKKFTVYIWRE